LQCTYKFQAVTPKEEKKFLGDLDVDNIKTDLRETVWVLGN